MKMILNIAVILILALPCFWLGSDSYTLQFLGLVYTIGYYRNIVLPLWNALCYRIFL